MASKLHKLVHFAEYAAVSASVVGAIATITTRQPAYAVAPLSISAALSLVSRRQQNEALNQDIRQQSTQLQSTFASSRSLSELSADLKRSQTHIETLANSATVETLSAQIELIRQANASTNFDMARLAADIAQLNMAIARLEGLANNSDLASQIGHLQTASSDIQAENARLSGALSQMQTRINEVSINLSQTEEIAASIVSLRGDFDRVKARLEGLVDQPSDLETGLVSTLEEPDFSDATPQLPTADNFDLDINLGIDFGTGYTKVCFYDVGREQAEIVTFSERKGSSEKMALEEILLPTKLAILEDGTLLSGLTTAEWKKSQAPIQKTIDFIKMRLAHLDVGEGQWRLERISELDDELTVESCCAYYLAQVIERSQQWITTHRPDLFAGQTVRWSINVGVPVEYADSKVLVRFEKVLELAWLLKYTPIQKTNLTLLRLNRLIQHLQDWKARNLTTALDCYTTPEIAAAVWSFLSSREAQNGFYTFFDVGDGTLDGASFRFFRSGEGDLQVDFYSGKVEPLGVTAFTQQAADELNSRPQDIRQALSNEANDELSRQMQQSKIRRNVQSLVATVVIDGKDKHYGARRSSASDDIGETLKVFIGGGGGNTAFFQNTIESTHSDFKQGSAGIPPYQIKQIPPPKSLEINGLDPKDFNRFAVAYGLCIPNWERPDIKLPSQVEAVDSYLETESGDVPKYEDTRDMM